MTVPERSEDELIAGFVRTHFPAHFADDDDDESYGAAPPAQPSAPAPDLHAGARQQAEPNEDEQFEAYMWQAFPHLRR